MITAITTSPPPDNTSVQQLVHSGLAAAKAGNHGEARELFSRVVEVRPDDVDAWITLGCMDCCLGEIDGGIASFERALAYQPSHANARRNMVNALNMKMNRAIVSGDTAARLAACRGLLAWEPGDQAALVNLHDTLWSMGKPATLRDFSPTLPPERIGRKVLIACMPKSGSSWLFGAMTDLTGFPEDRYAQAFLQNEQEIHLPRVLETAARDGVIQQHCRATAPNVHILQAFGIRPLVLVRNVFDALLSLHDFWRDGAIRNTFHYADWNELDAGARLDLVIDAAAPWYLQFFASWVLAERENRLAVHWLFYEQMMADKAAALAGALDFLGLPVLREQIAASIAALDGEKGRTRFNRGIAGRGERTFSADQLARVRRLAAHYPSIDFSPIGL